MNPEDWALIQETFDLCLEQPESQWAELLSERHGDRPDLVQEIESLLQSDQSLRRGTSQPLQNLVEIEAAEAIHDLETTIELREQFVLAEKYALGDVIGRGGFGTVYEGRDLVLDRPVAVKVGNHIDPHLARRFLREAKISASLRHDNIVTIFDYGATDLGGLLQTVPYLVQELLDGEDLDQLLARRSLPSQEERLALLRDVARGLQFAHEQGVLHLDVKPANVRVLKSGRAKLLDFGIARVVDEQEHTLDQAAFGTVGYTSPEKMNGEPVDARSDLFSFGVLAYELLSLRAPFAGSSTAETLRLMERPALPLEEQLRRSATEAATLPSRDLCQIIDRCIALDKSERPGDFKEVIDALLSEPPKGEYAAADIPNPESRATATYLQPLLVLAVLVLATVALGLAVIATQSQAPVEISQPVDPPDAVATSSEGAINPEALEPGDELPATPPQPAPKRELVLDSAENEPESVPDGPAGRVPTQPEALPASTPAPVETSAAADDQTSPEDEVPSNDPTRREETDSTTNSRAPAPEEPTEQADLPSSVAEDTDTGTQTQVQATPPVLISQPAPVFPSRALRRGVGGNVLVAAYVSATGTVERVFVKSQTAPTDFGFEQEALDSVLRSTFEPGTSETGRQAMWTEILVVFEPP